MIGYYVHDRGEGHATRACAIAAHLDQPVTGLSSRERPAGWPGDWLRLPSDRAEGDAAGLGCAAPGETRAAGTDHATAAGALHWAPLHHPGLRRRMAALAAWIADAEPRLLVVDVSVEVALFARLLGVPIAVVAMPGDRRDDPHQLAYRVASLVLAPWPSWAHPTSGLHVWERKVRPVGAMSRFDDRAGAPPPGGRRVLVLGGSGGDGFDPADVEAARNATAGWSWETLGVAGRWESDPWPALQGADVVVVHAGQNAIAEVAAARRPAVVIPTARPHAEQDATARVLDQARLAVVRERWPAADRWPALLDKAHRMNGERWERWNDRRGAARAAALLDEQSVVHARDPGTAPDLTEGSALR